MDSMDMFLHQQIGFFYISSCKIYNQYRFIKQIFYYLQQRSSTYSFVHNKYLEYLAMIKFNYLQSLLSQISSCLRFRMSRCKLGRSGVYFIAFKALICSSLFSSFTPLWHMAGRWLHSQPVFGYVLQSRTAFLNLFLRAMPSVWLFTPSHVSSGLQLSWGFQ